MDRIQAISDEFAFAVKDAFIEVYGKPRDPGALVSIRPSWSDIGVKQGWTEPNPGAVLVGTEYGWVSDPYYSSDDNMKWDRVLEVLRDKGWNDVMWESINAAIHVIYWQPPEEWRKIMNKRIRDKMSGARR